MHNACDELLRENAPTLERLCLTFGQTRVSQREVNLRYVCGIDIDLCYRTFRLDTVSVLETRGERRIKRDNHQGHLTPEEYIQLPQQFII